MTTSPVVGITEELLAELEAEANASLGENGTGFVERVTGFSVIDLVAEVRRLRENVAQKAAPAAPAGWKLVPVEPTVEILAAHDALPFRQITTPEEVWAAMLAAAPAAPVAQEPVACCPYCGGTSGRCDSSFPHPRNAEQPDTVAVPRELLEDTLHEADLLLDRVNSLLQYAGSTGDDAQHGEAVSRMRALLAGGAE